MHTIVQRTETKNQRRCQLSGTRYPVPGPRYLVAGLALVFTDLLGTLQSLAARGASSFPPQYESADSQSPAAGSNQDRARVEDDPQPRTPRQWRIAENGQTRE